MAVSEVLKGFRKDGYGQSDGEDKKESSSPRVIKLTDDEAKALQGEDGREVTAQVTGRITGSELTVTSVQGSGSTMPDENMPEELMKKIGAEQAPTVRPQTMPYPS